MKLIINVLFKFITGLVQLVLLPLDLLVENALPSVATALTNVNTFLNYLKGWTCWAFSWLPLYSSTYTFICSVLIFKFGVTIASSGIKLAVKWWHALAP